MTEPVVTRGGFAFALVADLIGTAYEYESTLGQLMVVAYDAWAVVGSQLAPGTVFDAGDYAYALGKAVPAVAEAAAAARAERCLL